MQQPEHMGEENRRPLSLGIIAGAPRRSWIHAVGRPTSLCPSHRSRKRYRPDDSPPRPVRFVDRSTESIEPRRAQEYRSCLLTFCVHGVTKNRCLRHRGPIARPLSDWLSNICCMPAATFDRRMNGRDRVSELPPCVSIRPRFTMAGEYPWAADFRNRSLALRWSGATPRPLAYIMPNLFCPSALPRCADILSLSRPLNNFGAPQGHRNKVVQYY